MGHQVTLQRFELLAIFKADYVIIVDGTLGINGRLLLLNNRCWLPNKPRLLRRQLTPYGRDRRRCWLLMPNEEQQDKHAQKKIQPKIHM